MNPLAHIVVFAMILPFFAHAQTSLYINKVGGAVDSVRIRDIVSITFSAGAPSTVGVIAYYPLNGDTKDYSGNGNDCLSSGVIPMMDRFGNPSGAMAFSPSTSSCVAQFPSGFTATTLTISLWVKYSGQGTGNPRLFAVSGSGTNLHAYSLIVTHSFEPHHRLWFYVEPNSPTYNTFSASTVNDDTWKHVAVRYDGATVSFFVNGTLDHQESVVIPIQQISSGYLTLGHSLVGSSLEDRYAGGLDDARFYNWALTDSEIMNLFREGGYSIK